MGCIARNRGRLIILYRAPCIRLQDSSRCESARSHRATVPRACGYRVAWCGSIRARRGRCLLLAPVALIEPAPRQHAMPAMAAAGAEEAVRPAQPEQRRAALLLGTEGFAKRLVAQTTRARCNLEPHNRDPLIRNILRTYSLTCGVSRISRKPFDNPGCLGCPRHVLWRS